MIKDQITDLDHIVSNMILSQKIEFTPEDIVKLLDSKLSDSVEDSVLFEFVSSKIRAFWGARALTFTGFAYYVNF